MKRFILTLVLLVSTLGLYAANINHIATAFKSSNASLLGSCFDEKIEVILPGVKSQYTQKEAIELFETFFKQNKTSTYSITHHAEKKERGFYVAQMGTGSKDFRVNITYLSQGGSILIQSIRIE